MVEDTGFQAGSNRRAVLPTTRWNYAALASSRSRAWRDSSVGTSR